MVEAAEEGVSAWHELHRGQVLQVKKKRDQAETTLVALRNAIAVRSGGGESSEEKWGTAVVTVRIDKTTYVRRLEENWWVVVGDHLETR